MILKPVFRHSPSEQHFRLLRLIWNRNGVSSKISIGIRAKLFGWESSFDGWRLTLLGLHVSHRRSWGGRFA